MTPRRADTEQDDREPISGAKSLREQIEDAMHHKKGALYDRIQTILRHGPE